MEAPESVAVSIDAVDSFKPYFRQLAPGQWRGSVNNDIAEIQTGVALLERGFKGFQGIVSQRVV